MKTFTFNMHVCVNPADEWSQKHANVIDGVEYRVYGFKPLDAAGTAIVQVTMHEGFDPVQSFVKDLEEQKRRITAEFTARVEKINDQLKRFTALEMA